MVDDSNTTDKQTYDEQVADELQSKEVEPTDQDDNDWVKFQRRVYREHSKNEWYGSVSYNTTQAVYTLNFNWLFSGTKYQVCGYHENIFGNESTMAIHYFDTTSLDTVQPWYINFIGEVLENFETEIREKCSFYQGVNPKRNRFDDRVPATSRRLQTVTTSTKFKYTMYMDRREAEPDTATLAVLNTDEKASIDTELTFSNKVD